MVGRFFLKFEFPNNVESLANSRRTGKSDYDEQKDVSAENHTKKAKLTALFDNWNESMQPPRWEDNRWNGDPDRKAEKKSNRNPRKTLTRQNNQPFP